MGDVLALAPLADVRAGRLVLVSLDLCGLRRSITKAWSTSPLSPREVPEDVVVAYSHTHSAGWLVPDRAPCPAAS